MSLETFHRCFIVLATVLSWLVVGWGAAQRDAASLGLAAAAAACGLLLPIYLARRSGRGTAEGETSP